MLKTSAIILKLRKLTEYFVNYERILQSDEQYRARILVGCLLVMTFYSVLIALLMAFEHFRIGLDPTGLFMSVSIGCFYIVCLFLLKRTAQTLIIAHAFAIPLYLSLLIACFIAGGPDASSNQIMILVPLIVFFTAGARSGFIWGAIVFITQTVIFLLYLKGFEFKQAMDAQTQIDQGFLHWVITLSGIIGIAYVYERAHQNLVNQRNMRDSDNRFLTDHDLLTGVSNRHSLVKQIHQHMKSTHKHKMLFTFCMIDINHLQQINARYGYNAGDNILLTLATRFKTLNDIKIIARTNGNQFTLVCHAHNKDFDIEQLITDILELASQPFSIGHQIITLNFTLGITQFFDGMMTCDELMIQAEDSLKTAKNSGLNYSIYTGSAINRELQ